MALTLTETDSTTGVCAGAGIVDRRVANGESAGSTPASVSFSSSAADITGVAFTGIIAASVTWDAGNFVVRLNVTTANMNLTWISCTVLRVNSACVTQATMGTVTGLAINLGTTGVKSSGNISCTAQTPGVGDKVLITLNFDNAAMSIQAFSFTPDQNIDSPFTAPVAFIAKPPVMITRQSRNRASLH